LVLERKRANHPPLAAFDEDEPLGAEARAELLADAIANGSDFATARGGICCAEAKCIDGAFAGKAEFGGPAPFQESFKIPGAAPIATFFKTAGSRAMKETLKILGLA
jgi:hypothetical protein